MRVSYERPARNFRLPVDAVKTYQVLQPAHSHWRPATCSEVDCNDYVNGWRVRLETLTDAQKHAIRTCGRKFTILSICEGTTYLVFEAGQECFRSFDHRAPLGKPGIYVVRDGDPWRGNPRGTPHRVHSRPEHWQEDFGEHQQRLYDRWKKG